MGTNYYLRSRIPRIEVKEVFEEHHIAKRSYGWHPLFQKVYLDDTTIDSIQGIRDAVDSGKWQIFDEYGSPVTIEEFEEIIPPWPAEKEHNIRRSGHAKYDTFRITVDDEGNEWTGVEFS